MAAPDWKSLVIRHARTTGAPDLPVHAVDELAAHLEDLYLEALGAGRTEQEARSAAEHALAASVLSQVPRSRMRLPESRVEPTRHGLHGIGGDVRFAWRQIKGSPAFAAVAVLTLGIGAGAATAIFSIVDTVLLRPLPYRDAAALVSIWDANAAKGLSRERISPVNFMDQRALQSVFVDAAAWWRPDVNLAEPGVEPIRVSTIEASANLFQVLGVSPQFGPGFPQDGPLFSRDQIAVISERLWRTRYSADPAIVGRRIDVNEGHYTIVGVMPRGFNFPDEVDVWLRLDWDLTQHSRGAHFMEAVARLKPDVTVEQAARELAGLSARLGEEHAATNGGWIARPVPLLDDMLGYYRPALLVLLGAVALLLVTACLNVASLLLARATVRAREIAVRAALGASRGRLVRQMLVESLLLAGAGTAVGGVSAVLLLKVATAAAPVSIPRLDQVTVDVRLLAFALCVAAGTAVLFGLLPALVLARTNASEALKDGTRSATAVRGHRWNHLLVVAEVALACSILAASALLVRSVSRMLAAPLGVTTEGIVTGSLQVTATGYADWAAVDQFYDALLEAVRRQPGIEAAGAANAIPLETAWRMPVGIEGRPIAATERPVVQHVSVTSGYFETFRAGLLEGRLFERADRASTEPVVVVNETFARRFFAGDVAVGKRIVSDALGIGPLGRNLSGRVPFRIVGVIADVRQAPLGQPDEAVVYHSARQFPFRPMTIVARGPDARTVSTALQRAVRGLDRALPIGATKTMRERLLERSSAPRLLTFVLTAFATLTGILAAVGVYGLLACVVNGRRRELAIRLALGARPASLAALVTRQGLTLAALGIAVGLAAVQVAGTLLQRVLFETATTDVVALTVSGVLLLSAAAIACVAPARRAAAVAPVEGLNAEV